MRALSPLGKLVYEYLRSNPMVTSSGIYVLNVHMAADDLSLDVHEFEERLGECECVHERVAEPVPMVRARRGVVWVVGQWKHAVNHSPTHRYIVGSEFIRAPRLPFWREFFQMYPEVAATLSRKQGKFTRADEFRRLLREIQHNPHGAKAEGGAGGGAGGMPRGIRSNVEREKERTLSLKGRSGTTQAAAPAATGQGGPAGAAKVAAEDGDLPMDSASSDQERERRQVLRRQVEQLSKQNKEDQDHDKK